MIREDPRPPGSPTTARAAIATTQGLWQAQNFLSNMTKTQMENFLSSPQAMNKFITGFTSAPMVREQVQSKLQQYMQPQPQSGQPGGQ